MVMPLHLLWGYGVPHRRTRASPAVTNPGPNGARSLGVIRRLLCRGLGSRTRAHQTNAHKREATMSTAAGSRPAGRSATATRADARTPAQWYCLIFGATLL